MRLDVPGVEPKDIEIQLNGHVLTVSGHRKEEKEERERCSTGLNDARASSPDRGFASVAP